MRVFKIPYDIKREEKIFGGYLSLRQVMYLLITASTLAIFITGIPIILKLLFIGTVSTFFLLCTFLKIGEQNFDKFFFYAIKYLFRKKKFIYSRRDF